jgi:hypothetical protein
VRGEQSAAPFAETEDTATAKVTLKWSLSRNGRRRKPRLTSDYDESESLAIGDSLLAKSKRADNEN